MRTCVPALELIEHSSYPNRCPFVRQLVKFNLGAKPNRHLSYTKQGHCPLIERPQSQTAVFPDVSIMKLA